MHAPRSLSQRSPHAIRLTDLYATASHEKGEDNTADMALTDNRDEVWNAGRTASPDEPVYLDIDIPAGMVLDHLTLVPYQVPTTGETHHQVLVDNEIVADIQGVTTHSVALGPVAIGRAGRRVRVQTLRSPSWVAWQKVEVWGCPESGQNGS